MLPYIGSLKTVDLTHTFSASTPMPDGLPALTVAPMYDGAVQVFTHAGQFGTHVDAPGHFHKGMRLVDDIPADEFLLEGCAVDIRDQVALRVVDGKGRTLPPGKTGEILVSNLINRATVLLNYRTGDLGMLSAGPCPCGRTLPTIELLDGRTDDVLAAARRRGVPRLGDPAEALRCAGGAAGTGGPGERVRMLPPGGRRPPCRPRPAERKPAGGILGGRRRGAWR